MLTLALSLGGGHLKYATVLNDIKTDVFCREDVLEAILKMNPDYNTKAFNRHFSKLLLYGGMECVGENSYIKVRAGKARKTYLYSDPSAELSSTVLLLDTEFPRAEFIVMETTMLNEFLNHQIAQSTIIVLVERMLMDTFFERLKEQSPSVLFAPTTDDLLKYGRNGTVVVEKLSARYPKNPVQKRSFSIEKLSVDIFAERIIKDFINIDDCPLALEIIFKKYRINETRLFNYARERRVDVEIRTMIKDCTKIELYTDKMRTRLHDI